MNNMNGSFQKKSTNGFSLVDVMVGMVIAMLGMVIMFQVFSVSEGIKRTTTSGGEALQNGSSALFSLERSIKLAGYGIFDSSNLPPLPADPVGTALVLITPGVANASDTIIVAYRQNWEFGPFPPDPVVFPSATPSLLPTIETLSVNAQAQLTSNVNDNGAVTNNVISDGIALLKAEYGTDINGNGVVDIGEWNQAAPANVRSVMAVRLALVARSVQPEKPSVAGGACDTTTVFPTWIDSATVPLDISGNVGLAAGDDWKCYRYKTFENTVPLRN